MITRAISVLLLVVLSANSLNYKRVKGKNNLEAKLFSAELFKTTSSPYAVKHCLFAIRSKHSQVKVIPYS
jgi:hypothetical protein